MTDRTPTEIVQAIRRELIDHHAKIDALAASHHGHHCRMGAYLEGYGDAIQAMTEAMTGALTDALHEEQR